MHTYIASHVSSDQNALYPDMLEIDTDMVVYYKGYVFGYKTIIIKRRNIVAVTLRAGIFFADVVISSSGEREIIARGFTKSKAKEILRLLL